ncbi:MAG TPA: hypothetical protein VLG38_05230, partial [Gammaproteobacteria bacterium]|nr:hypothetical protein [Gammaproteobacteria bacterium]
MRYILGGFILTLLSAAQGIAGVSLRGRDDNSLSTNSTSAPDIDLAPPTILPPGLKPGDVPDVIDQLQHLGLDHIGDCGEIEINGQEFQVEKMPSHAEGHSDFALKLSGDTITSGMLNLIGAAAVAATAQLTGRITDIAGGHTIITPGIGDMGHSITTVTPAALEKIRRLQSVANIPSEASLQQEFAPSVQDNPAKRMLSNSDSGTTTFKLKICYTDDAVAKLGRDNLDSTTSIIANNINANHASSGSPFRVTASSCTVSLPDTVKTLDGDFSKVIEATPRTGDDEFIIVIDPSKFSPGVGGLGNLDCASYYPHADYLRNCQFAVVQLDSALDLAGAAVHELGHNLGLYHDIKFMDQGIGIFPDGLATSNHEDAAKDEAQYSSMMGYPQLYTVHNQNKVSDIIPAFSGAGEVTYKGKKYDLSRDATANAVRDLKISTRILRKALDKPVKSGRRLTFTAPVNGTVAPSSVPPTTHGPTTLTPTTHAPSSSAPTATINGCAPNLARQGRFLDLLANVGSRKNCISIPVPDDFVADAKNAQFFSANLTTTTGEVVPISIPSDSVVAGGLVEIRFYAGGLCDIISSGKEVAVTDPDAYAKDGSGKTLLKKRSLLYIGEANTTAEDFTGHITLDT